MVEFTAASANPSLTATALNMSITCKISGLFLAPCPPKEEVLQSAEKKLLCGVVYAKSRRSSSCRSPLRSLRTGRILGQAGRDCRGGDCRQLEGGFVFRFLGGRRLPFLSGRSFSEESVLLPLQLG